MEGKRKKHRTKKKLFFIKLSATQHVDKQSIPFYHNPIGSHKVFLKSPYFKFKRGTPALTDIPENRFCYLTHAAPLRAKMRNQKTSTFFNSSFFRYPLVLVFFHPSFHEKILKNTITRSELRLNMIDLHS